jgi:hypothetical protein
VWVISFTSRPLIPRESACAIVWLGGWVYPRMFSILARNPVKVFSWQRNRRVDPLMVLLFGPTAWNSTGKCTLLSSYKVLVTWAPPTLLQWLPEPNCVKEKRVCYAAVIDTFLSRDCKVTRDAVVPVKDLMWLNFYIDGNGRRRNKVINCNVVCTWRLWTIVGLCHG